MCASDAHKPQDDSFPYVIRDLTVDDLDQYNALFYKRREEQDA